MQIAKNYKKIILIVAMISLAGVTFGITMPLSTLTLKSWGISSTMIGLNSAMPALSAVLLTPFLPKIMNHWGQRNVIRFCLVLVATCCICLPLFPNLFSWFILRFLLGAGATGIWVLSEVWINSFAEDYNRGKIIGAYSALLSLGFIVGVLMFSVIGVESNTAFYLAAGFVIIAAIPVWTMSDLPNDEMAEDVSFWQHMVSSPGLMGSSWMMGFLYAATAYLLPIFALQFDLNYAQSSRTIAWLGSVICLALRMLFQIFLILNLFGFNHAWAKIQRQFIGICQCQFYFLFVFGGNHWSASDWDGYGPFWDLCFRLVNGPVYFGLLGDFHLRWE